MALLKQKREGSADLAWHTALDLFDVVKRCRETIETVCVLIEDEDGAIYEVAAVDGLVPVDRPVAADIETPDWDLRWAPDGVLELRLRTKNADIETIRRLVFTTRR
jgi:hypothetical protein